MACDVSKIRDSATNPAGHGDEHVIVTGPEPGAGSSMSSSLGILEINPVNTVTGAILFFCLGLVQSTGGNYRGIAWVSKTLVHVRKTYPSTWRQLSAAEKLKALGMQTIGLGPWTLLYGLLGAGFGVLCVLFVLTPAQGRAAGSAIAAVVGAGTLGPIAGRYGALLELSSVRTPWTAAHFKADREAFAKEFWAPVALLRALRFTRLLATGCHKFVHLPGVRRLFSPPDSNDKPTPSVRIFFTWVMTFVGAAVFASVGEYLTLIVSNKTTFTQELGMFDTSGCAALRGAVCGASDCKRYADGMRGRSCADFCCAAGMRCVAAFEEAENNCVEEEVWSCDQTTKADGGSTDDLICECDGVMFGNSTDYFAACSGSMFGNSTEVSGRSMSYRFERATFHIFRQLREERDSLYEYDMVQVLLLGIASLIWDCFVVFYHLNNPPHPKFRLRFARRLSIYTHIWAGASEIVLSVFSFVNYCNEDAVEKGDCTEAEVDVHIMLIYSTVFCSAVHTITAAYQTPQVFGMHLVMVPVYTLTVCWKAVSILRLVMRPQSLWLLIQLFFTHREYGRDRTMFLVT